MSSSKTTDVVQAQVTVPSLSDVNPLNTNDPLIQKLVQGEVPSNADLNNALDKAKGKLEASRQEANLNNKGDTLAKDAEQILESAQRFINEKNAGDKLQELIKHSQEASDATSKEASKTTSKLSNMIGNTLGLESLISTKDIKAAQSDAERAYGYARELVYFTIQSREFRSFLLDMINFLQSSLDTVNDKVQQLGESLKTDVQLSNTNLTNTTQQANQVKEDAKDKVDQKLTQWNEQTKREYYKRFQSLLNRISEKPEFKRLLDIFWKWMDDLQVRAVEVGTQLSENIKETASQAKDTIVASADKVASISAWDKLWNDVRAIVDAFGGQGSFDNFYKQSWQLYYSISNDKEANVYFKSLKAFINDAVNNPTSLNSDVKMTEGEELLVRGRILLTSDRFGRKFNGVMSAGSDLLNKITNDAVTNELADGIKKFAQDFALDNQGRPDLNVIQDSLIQIKNLVIPLMSKQLSALSIARITGTNESYDWAVENMLVSIPNLIPEHFELRTKNLLSINVKELETEKNNTKVTMEVKNMRPVFRDLKFWYQRKTFPKMEDYGTVDVDLSKGQGVRIKIIWKIKSQQNRPFAFSLMEVRCVIDNLTITVKDAKHNIMDRIASSLFSASMKQQLAANIVNSIVDSLQPFNDQMNQWFTSRPTASLYDKANESMHYYFDQTNQAIKDHPIDKLVNKANETITYVKDNVQSTIESAKVVVAEKATELKETVEQKFPGTTASVNQGIENVKAKTNEIGENLVDLKDKATEKAVELKDKATEKAVELKDKVAEKAEEAKEEIEVPVEHYWESKPGRKQKKRHHKKSNKGVSVLELESEMEFPPLEADAI